MGHPPSLHLPPALPNWSTSIEEEEENKQNPEQHHNDGILPDT